MICKTCIFKLTHEIILVFLFKEKGENLQQIIKIKMQVQGNKYLALGLKK